MAQQSNPIVEVLEEGLLEASLWMSDHECHNADCSDARAVEKIKAAIPLARQQAEQVERLKALVRDMAIWFQSAKANPKAWRPIDREAASAFVKRARKELDG